MALTYCPPARHVEVAKTLRVVLTRQPAQAGAMELELKSSGYSVGFFPLTDFQLPADQTRLAEMIDQLHTGVFQWLLITSPNTIRALKALGWDAARTENYTRIAVTGTGTAKVLAEAGALHTPWMPQHASAQGLQDELPVGDGRQLALPQSEAAGGAMRDFLQSRGWHVMHSIAYQTVDYPAESSRRILPEHQGSSLNLEEIRDHDAVILTAPSAVQRLPEQLSKHPQLIAIGQPTRRAAEQRGIGLLATCETPDAQGIQTVLENFIHHSSQ